MSDESELKWWLERRTERTARLNGFKAGHWTSGQVLAWWCVTAGGCCTCSQALIYLGTLAGEVTFSSWAVQKRQEKVAISELCKNFTKSTCPVVLRCKNWGRDLLKVCGRTAHAVFLWIVCPAGKLAGHRCVILNMPQAQTLTGGRELCTKPAG